MGVSPLVKSAESHPQTDFAAPGRPTLWGPGRSQRQTITTASANFDTLRPLGRLAEADLLLHTAHLNLCGIQEGKWFQDASVSENHYHFLFTSADKDGRAGVGLAIKHTLYPSLMAYRFLGPRLL